MAAADSCGPVSAVNFMYAWSQSSGPPLSLFRSGPKLATQLTLAPYSFRPNSTYRLTVNVSAPPPYLCAVLSSVNISTLPFQPPVIFLAGVFLCNFKK